MKILLNDLNEIIGYVTDGDLKGSIQAEIPDYLLEDFQPRKLVYVNGKVEINNNYSEEVSTPVQPPVVNVPVPGSDDELRKMFASMQVQLVQLSQEMIILNQKLGEVTNDEDVISNI